MFNKKQDPAVTTEEPKALEQPKRNSLIEQIQADLDQAQSAFAGIQVRLFQLNEQAKVTVTVIEQLQNLLAYHQELEADTAAPPAPAP